MKFIVRWVREKGETIVKLKDTPASIARGVAIGTFFGFVPVIGLKTLLSMGVAKLSKSNVISAVIAVTLHDLFIPIAVYIVILQYNIGMAVLGRSHKVSKTLAIDGPAAHHFKFSDFWHDGFRNTIERLATDLKDAGWPTALGSVIFSLPLALLAYWLTYRMMTRIRLRQAAEAAKEV